MAKRVKKVQAGVDMSGEILRGTRVAMGGTNLRIGQVDAAGKFVLSVGYTNKLVGKEGKGLSSLGYFLCGEIERMTLYKDVEEQLADVEEFMGYFEEYRGRLKAKAAALRGEVDEGTGQAG